MYTGFYGSFVFYYRIVIGVRLLLAAVHMLFTFPAREETRSVNTLLAVVTGILPGYFSGLTGVGGEIFSVHCCCCLRWASMRDQAILRRLLDLVLVIAAMKMMLTA